jgi:hypothetical protein
MLGFLQTYDITITVTKTITDSVPLLIRVNPSDIPRQNIPMFYNHGNKKRLFEKNRIKHQFLAFGEGLAHGLAFLSFFEEAKFLLDFLDFLVGDLAVFDGPASEVFFRVGFLL